MKITESGANTLSAAIDASPMFKTVIESFERDLTDYYLGRASVEFSPLAPLNLQRRAFDFCCLLPYVERNTYPIQDVSDNSCYREVMQWSVRQQALYSSYSSPNAKTDTTVLVNPADELWRRLKSKYSSCPVLASDDEGWQEIPCIVFESLTHNWATYIGCLHRAVDKIVGAKATL